MNEKISRTDLPATTRYHLHDRLEGMPRHTKLCHGDFNASNVVMADDGSCCAGKCNREGVTITVDDEVYTGVTRESFSEFFRKAVLEKSGK